MLLSHVRHLESYCAQLHHQWMVQYQLFESFTESHYFQTGWLVIV